jgi:SAM-dependent methyltransferase
MRNPFGVKSPMPDDTLSGFQLAAGVPARYEAFVAPLMRPFVDVLVGETLGVGDAVLDVACGTGFVARAAALMVGPTGSVAAIDINPGMLEEAQANPASQGLNVDWRLASALDLPFPDATFDAVLCQQGLQFFPDPVAGLVEMRRVLKPGGRGGATVWAPVERSPYIAAQFELIAEFVGVGLSGDKPPCPPGGETALLAWASRAGCTAAQVVAIERTIHLPNLASHIPNHLTALPWSARFFELGADVQSRAVASMMSALIDYVDSEGNAHIPTTTLLLTFTGS